MPIVILTQTLQCPCCMVKYTWKSSENPPAYCPNCGEALMTRQDKITDLATQGIVAVRTKGGFAIGSFDRS